MKSSNVLRMVWNRRRKIIEKSSKTFLKSMKYIFLWFYPIFFRSDQSKLSNILTNFDRPENHIKHVLNFWLGKIRSWYFYKPARLCLFSTTSLNFKARQRCACFEWQDKCQGPPRLRLKVGRFECKLRWT